jgi:hypothetical protein
LRLSTHARSSKLIQRKGTRRIKLPSVANLSAEQPSKREDAKNESNKEHKPGGNTSSGMLTTFTQHPYTFAGNTKVKAHSPPEELEANSILLTTPSPSTNVDKNEHKDEPLNCTLWK